MPTENDLLLQTSDSTDADNDSAAIDTRLRIGSPRRNLLGTTETDAQIAHDAALGLPPANLPAYADGLTIQPDASDPLGPVKRALMFTPRTGVNLTSGGHFNAYLRQSFDVCVLDGPINFQAIDHDFKPDPKNKPDVVEPALTYLRIGKPEKKADGTAGDPKTDLATEPLAGQKFSTGIGIFSHGTLNAWTKKEINFASDEKIKLLSKDVQQEYSGENLNVGYEYNNLDDDKKAKAGTAKAGDLQRRIISVDFRRKAGITWYQQSFKNNLNIAFNAALKGDVAFSASYGMAIGAKIDHSVGISFATAVSAKSELKLSYEHEIGKSGAVFKGTAGDWTQKDNNVVVANERITLKIDRLGSLPFKVAAERFTIIAEGSAAAQMKAMSAYNAVLIGMARVDISAGQDDDKHGLKSALDAGAPMYMATTLLSILTAAAGILLAALQAKNVGKAQVPVPGGGGEITLSEGEIILKCGASSITLTPSSLTIDAPTLILNGQAQIRNNAPVIDNNPVPQPALPNVDVAAAAAAAAADVDVEAAAAIPEAPPM